ncbi:MAG: hypothetical protein KGQ59_08710, partial [Bdellovibrionales bacterium]|nr:hypothetical protein [Bdellovibrionales bacterium]
MFPRPIKIVVLGVVFTGLVGCGSNKSKDAAAAMKGLFDKSNSSSSAMRMAKEQLEQARSQALGQAWVAKFSQEAGQPLQPMTGESFSDPDYSCT